MAFLWGLTVLMLMSCTTSTADDKEYSEAFLKLLYVFNGKFSDGPVVEAYKNVKKPKVDVPKLLYVTATPVEIPALAPAVTFYYEKYVENSLYRRLILVFKEENGQIFAQPYNITSPPNDLSKPFTIDQVKKLTSNDLTTTDACKIQFTRKGANSFTALWPDCKVQDNGVFPKYHLTWSCDSLMAIISSPKHLDYTTSPVALIREAPRYPFPSYLKAVEDNSFCQ
ncbi:uncharacterized protein LOC131954273 [Physella acuta]|uniref:uncharacterized protein LOC131954273 n=1 Tax=Physella acuta TaxID=109671 RepID=UPI0027DAE6EE|nr:uncharacterized protein LOC131954273 [Physella acuta]